MKVFLVLAALITLPLCAEMPFPLCDTGRVCGGVSECGQNKFRMGGEWLYLKTRKADLDYAMHDDGVIFSGKVENIKPRYNSGYRLFIEGESSGLFVGGRYIYFKANKDQFVEDLTFSHLAACRLPSKNAYTTPGHIQRAQGDYHIHMHMGQLESGYSTSWMRSVHATLLGGCSAVFIKQKLHLLYAQTASDLCDHEVLGALDSIASYVHMDAYGPYAGVKMHWEWMRGVGLYSRATVGSLIGKFNRGYVHAGRSSGVSIQTDDAISETTYRVLTHIDIASGFFIEGWRFLCGYAEMKLGFTIGCEMHHFINGADFLDVHHSHSPDEHRLDHHSDGLGFDGLHMGLTLEF